MKKILVTGGAGFIGSNFIRRMLNKHNDWFIVNLDKLTYAGNLKNLVDIERKSNYVFVKGDIRNRELVNYLFEKYQFDYVVNFAAESHVDRSILGAKIFFETNVIGTVTLLEAAKNFGITKFIQISTDEVYGSLGETGYFYETTPLSPNSPYSASKASADLTVMAYHHTFSLPASITRCSNNYGPFQFPEKLIPLMIINTLNNKKLPVYGDGKNIRDWIHVDDHNDAVELVLLYGKAGEVYNIGTNSEMMNIDIVKIILEHFNKDISMIEFVKDRPGHDRRYAINSDKIKSELGWSPKKDFKLSLQQTINWYVENRNWWNEIISGEYQFYYEKLYSNR